MSAYLQTKSLVKDFGGGRGAFDINITISPGEIVGFIGPNGAGKTTTMRMIMRFLRSDQGSVELFGRNIDSDQVMEDVISRVGFMPGEVSLYRGMNAVQLFDYTSQLYGRNYSGYALELAAELELDIKRPFKYLSMGNKKKLGFIHAVMHHPDLIILDEPTAGMDPLVQQKVLNVIKNAREKGKAVFLSSHTLSEVQQVCDRIIMIKDGRIILQDTTKDILAKAVKIFRIDNVDEKLGEKLGHAHGVQNVEKAGADYTVYVTETKAVLELLVEAGRYDFYLERTSLENMFLAEYK